MPKIRLKSVITEPHNYKVCNKCLSINLRENKKCNSCKKTLFSYGYEAVDNAVSRIEDKILGVNDEVFVLNNAILSV